jgi:hypothetical protein
MPVRKGCLICVRHQDREAAARELPAKNSTSRSSADEKAMMILNIPDAYVRGSGRSWQRTSTAATAWPSGRRSKRGGSTQFRVSVLIELLKQPAAGIARHAGGGAAIKLGIGHAARAVADGAAFTSGPGSCPDVASISLRM